MDDIVITRFLSLPLESVFLFIALNMLRPFGLMFGFLAFGWGMATSVLPRAAISIALSLPIMLTSIEGFADLRANLGGANIALVLIKEFALGYGLGVLASLPFLALQFAGAITDTYRGESNAGTADPSGGQLQTFGLLYLLIGLSGFFAAGGLWRLIDGVYQSYVIWPIGLVLPDFTGDAGLMVAGLVDALLRDALLIAAPLLIIFVAIDFALAIAARLAQRFRLYEHAFLSKNLTAMVALPILVLYLARANDGRMDQSLFALPLLDGLLK